MTSKHNEHHKRPQPSLYDPLYTVKQDVELYGDTITQREVLTLVQLDRSVTDRDYRSTVTHYGGPTVRKHFRSGYVSAQHHFERSFKEALLKYWPELLENWSASGAADKAYGRLYNLHLGIEKGVWK